MCPRGTAFGSVLPDAVTIAVNAVFRKTLGPTWGCYELLTTAITSRKVKNVGRKLAQKILKPCGKPGQTLENIVTNEEVA
jgi:hypothetical protein